ncbi:type II toxin-antitoxin system RelE/ParE family toxin [Candidatus Poribacteria bacterium]|nr:type II toxin-antitoxin system RelE/ParE family toxin [Candidatus Poribacteria bacterium]
MYELVLTEDAREVYQRANKTLLKKLNRCFRQLRTNPYRHPNIKRLTGNLAGRWRYRMGDWRVIYRVTENPPCVTVLMIVSRGSAYIP